MPEKENQSEKPKADTTDSDTGIIGLLQKDWPKVLERLSSQRKMTLLSTLKAGKVVPAKVEGRKLFLLNHGDAVYEEIILGEKHTIEEIIKEISNVDITVKGFVSKESFFPLEAEAQDTDKSTEKGEQVSDEEFGQKL